jgi:hypothetical protein
LKRGLAIPIACGRAIPIACGLAILVAARPCQAKEFGLHTPSGRQIYDRDEEFANVANSRKRRFVVEAAAGAGPEGNVAALVGLLNWPVRRLDLYAGFGYEANPSRHYTLSARYTFNVHGYHPYVSAGYLHNDLYRLGTFTHEAFAELGYTWIVHDTFRFSIGVGTRYQLYLRVRDDSLLHDEQVDPVLLSEQTDSVVPWVPTLTLRFSRAF